MRFDLLLRGGTLVTPSGVAVGDVGVAGGRIVDVGALDPASADQLLDCRGLHVLPGLIDSQVRRAARA